MVGGTAGVVLAFGGVRLIRRMEPGNLPRLDEIGIDPTVLAFALGVTVLAGLLFSLQPILRRSGTEMMMTLKDGGRGSAIGGGRHGARNTLMVVQVAMALVLLTASGLMVRTFQALRQVDPGFADPEDVLTVRVAMPTTEIASGAEVMRGLEGIWRGLDEIPGVSAAGGSTSVTMDGFGVASTLSTEDPPHPAAGEAQPIRRFKWVSGEYFTTMGNPVLAGRAIDWSDIHDGATVAMVTDDLAREFWADASDALGRRIRFGTGPWREIIGVVGNVRDLGVDDPTTQIAYFPLDSSRYVRMGVSFAIRTNGRTPTSILPDVRLVVSGVDPDLPVASVRTLDEILARSMGRTSFALAMIAIAAAVALSLGLIGIYGVITYVVSQRTREIGVRMAVGAQARDVRRMVVRQAGTLIGLGVAIGLVASVGLTRVLASLLYGVEATDPTTFATVTAALAAVALTACYVPARRASQVDPVEALRAG
jgi:predicted permease